MRLTRRAFARAAGASLAVLGSGSTVLGRGLAALGKTAGSTDKRPYRTLDPAEVATLERLADALVPGARQAGVARFIDDQLSGPVEKNELIVKYLGVPRPFARFYKDALKAADKAARELFGSPVPGLDAGQTARLVAAIAKGRVPGWSGPPSPLFQFALRSDGLDVVYGTRTGFARLNIPYMAHIVPPSDW